jgi:pimeloyl-ACP methyl ester carboxylesterase
MPYVNNQGVRIRYEIEGTGPPLVLHHGFSGRLEFWREFGYTNYLQHHFKLILLDGRGHGKSDKPHDVEAYELPKRVADIVAILDDLEIEQAHFFGYSMGGWIGFGMARYASERLRSLVIGGAHPFHDPSWDVFKTVSGDDPDGFITALETVIEEQIPIEVQPVVLENDLHALAAAAQERPSLEDVLAKVEMPCLLFVGEADSRLQAVRECAALIKNAIFESFPDLSHVGCYWSGETVARSVSRFLLGVSNHG